MIEAGGEKKYRVKNGAGFQPGDVVAFSVKNEDEVVYNRVVSNQDNQITFAEEFPSDVVDTDLAPVRTISTCELNLEIRYEDQTESYENVSFNVTSPNYIDKKLSRSDLVFASYVGTPSKAPVPPFEEFTGGVSPVISLAGGSNGSVGNISAADFIGTDNGAGRRTGIQAFVDNDVVSIMAVPGITDPNVQLTLVAHCENLGSRFAILDIPREYRKIQDVTAHREIFDSTYAALYHPWLEVFDPLDKKNIALPPSGSVAGIYARSDNTRGVHKAPANEVVRSCVGLDCQFNKGEQDILNPKGVNLIRIFPGQGIRVWGARTASSMEAGNILISAVSSFSLKSPSRPTLTGRYLNPTTKCCGCGYSGPSLFS